MSSSPNNPFPFHIQRHFKAIIDSKPFHQLCSQFLLSKHKALLNININEDDTLLNSSVLTEESILNIRYISNINYSSEYTDIQKLVDIMQ